MRSNRNFEILYREMRCGETYLSSQPRIGRKANKILIAITNTRSKAHILCELRGKMNVFHLFNPIFSVLNMLPHSLTWSWHITWLPLHRV